MLLYSFETPLGGSTWDRVDLELESGRVEEKTLEGKNPA
jgi:hypothetical protein